MSDATSVDLKWTESDFTRLGSNATVTSFGGAGLDPNGVPAADGVMYYVMGQDYSIVPGMSDIYRDAKTIGGNILSKQTNRTHALRHRIMRCCIATTRALLRRRE